ncbi:hypothetical protein PR048_026600 [Dryococelus australis]|uniref:Vacuolar protein sorting-associated protein 33B n=1 Tax=Dryococelus australis TaxID=614101 RepID=A0ABQ9GLU0_9NEOP|nr:hypothetical protein PR048_026600 [Dryococelus australis]
MLRTEGDRRSKLPVLPSSLRAQSKMPSWSLRQASAPGSSRYQGGFPINKSLLVENLHGESLIAQRMVYDAIKHYGGILNVPVDGKMLLSVSAARSKYRHYLGKKLQQEKDAKKTREEKRKIANEIGKLKEEKRLETMELEEVEEKRNENFFITKNLKETIKSPRKVTCVFSVTYASILLAVLVDPLCALNAIDDCVVQMVRETLVNPAFMPSTSQGIEKIFKLKQVGVGCENSQCVYLVLADLITVKRVCDQINAEIAHNRNNVYHLIVVPCSLVSIEQLLEEEGIYGEVTVHTFAWEMHHIETNLLSLELPCMFRMLFADGDYSFLPVVAHSLWSLQMLFGKFPLFLAYGRFAVQVQKMQELLLEESSGVEKCASEIGCVVLVDRDIDYASILLTPVTYSALLDEVFGITGGTIELDERVLGANKTLTYKLSKNDEVYDNIKNKHFSDVYSFLSAKTKELQVEFEHSSKMALNEMKQYVSTQLQKVTASKRALAYHIGACEVVIGEMGQSFETRHTVEQNMLDGRNRRENINYVEEHLAIAGKLASLRLMCLASLTQDGLTQDEALSFKSQFLHAYGYEHLATFNNLEKIGLFTQQGSTLSLAGLGSDAAGKLADRVAQVVSLPKRSAFQAVAHKLKLFPNVNDKYDLRNPKDMAYVFSGSYIPAVCQLVQMLIKQELSADEILKLIPGPSSRTGSVSNGVVPQTFLVYYIGGVTYAEVAAFHLLEKQTGVKILVAGTSLTNGNKLIESALG